MLFFLHSSVTSEEIAREEKSPKVFGASSVAYNRSPARAHMHCVVQLKGDAEGLMARVQIAFHRTKKSRKAYYRYREPAAHNSAASARPRYLNGHDHWLLLWPAKTDVNAWTPVNFSLRSRVVKHVVRRASRVRSNIA